MASNPSALLRTGIGWYLYGFLPTCPDVSFDDLPSLGIDGCSPLSLITETGVKALVSPVPLTEFGEEAFRQNLEDLRWLEEKVHLHESIVESALAHGPLLPLKFGTIFLDLEKIQAVVRRNAPTLLAALEALRGKEQWGVKVYAEPAILQAAVIRNDPVLLAMSVEVSAQQPGQAFFLKKQIERIASSKSRECVEALFCEALGTIRETVVDMLEHPPFLPEARPEERMILNVECLVRCEGVTDFHAAIQRWSEGHAQEGVRLVVSGPWPPYHFVPRLDNDG